MSKIAHPDTYFDKPVEEWTFRDFHDVLGTDRVALALGTSIGNVRMLRFRQSTSLQRMQALQAYMRSFPDDPLAALKAEVSTLHHSGALRRRA